MEPGSGGFFLIRHGETTANRDGVRSGGDRDPPLTAQGRAQARDLNAVVRRLTETPDLIVAAPLKRTLETARLVNGGLGFEIRTEPQLVERRLGAWNGRSVEATRPMLDAGETPPGGESSVVFRDRLLAAFRSLAPLYRRWPLIVSSRGVARVVMERGGSERTVLGNGEMLRVALANSCEFRIARIDQVI